MPAAARPLDALMKFRIIINAVKRHFRWVEEQCGINGAQLWALWEIGRTRAMRVSELAAAMAMHQSSTSNLVERLARSGLIARRRNASDRRVVELVLTARGAALLRRAPRPARGLLPEALHRLPPATLGQLDAALAAVLRTMTTADTGARSLPLARILGD